MRTPLYLTLILATTFLVGCGQSSSPPNSPSATTAASVTNSWPFEGTYVDTNYNDRPTVTFKAGRYAGSFPSNPGGNINGSGHYQVRETGDGKWELDFKYDDGDRSTVVFVRKDGQDIVIRDASYGGETRLIKK